MARDRQPIQALQDGRLRTPVYHLKRPDRKNPPYVYLGKDRKRAELLLPLLQTALAETTTPQQAQGWADILLGATDLAAAKQRLLGILSSAYSRPQTPEEKETQADKGNEAYHGRYPDWTIPKHSPEKAPQFVATVFQKPGLLDKALGEEKSDIPTEKLQLCIDKWIEFKKNQKRGNEHVCKTKAHFQQLVDFLHDKPVAALTKDDFIRYNSWLLKQQKDYGPTWINSRLKDIAAVIRWATRKTNLPFPEGILRWVDFKDDLQRERKFQSNNKALPPDVYKRLVAKARELAEIDVDEYAESLSPEGANEGVVKANNMKQAKRVKRFGQMWQCILPYAANTGADNQDISWLTWDRLHLDEETPYMDLPRHKTDVPRMIPLLPETVEALKAWQEFDGKRAYVFCNDAKKQQDRTSVSDGFTKLRDLIEGGNGWCFKHLRKVGSNVGKRNGIDRDKRDTFLGHVPVGVTAEHYEDDCLTPTYLSALVDLIGREYFAAPTNAKTATRR